MTSTVTDVLGVKSPSRAGPPSAGSPGNPRSMPSKRRHRPLARDDPQDLQARGPWLSAIILSTSYGITELWKVERERPKPNEGMCADAFACPTFQGILLGTTRTPRQSLRPCSHGHAGKPLLGQV